MFFLKRIAVPYLAPAIIDAIAKMKICTRVVVGSYTFIGSSTMIWKMAIDRTDTIMPQT